MRRFSLFEFLSYGDDFWNEAEGVPSNRPVCPTCNTDGLEKEERMDERQDVWRCKNCKNRISDADFKKTTSTKTADKNKYWALKFDEDQFGGIFDLLTFAERIGFFDTIEASGFADKMFNELDLVYSDGPDENGMYVVNINGDEWEIFREIYDHIQYIKDENPEFFMAMMDQNDDLAFEDIMSAESVFVNTMPEASSEANLEDIPTMERNPDGSLPMGNCPQCGLDAVDPNTRDCLNCGWDEDNACPECFSDNSVYLEEDGTKHCNNCGWGEQSLPPAPQSALGPSTPAAKAMAAGNCPKCGQPTVEHELDSNVMKCPSCGWEDKKPPALSDAAKEVGDLQSQFELPSVEHPLGPHTGNNEEMPLAFYIKIGGPSFRPEWGVHIQLQEGQTPPQSGDTVIARRQGGFDSEVTLTEPVEGRQNVWRFVKPYYRPNTQERYRWSSNQELYTSGNFVKGPDGRWLVVINPSGGQRDPEPGDWATIQQRSKSFNRPVPLTLVEDMGGAWKFKNGHHPSIESQVEDETL